MCNSCIYSLSPRNDLCLINWIQLLKQDRDTRSKVVTKSCVMIIDGLVENIPDLVQRLGYYLQQSSTILLLSNDTNWHSKADSFIRVKVIFIYKIYLPYRSQYVTMVNITVEPFKRINCNDRKDKIPMIIMKVWPDWPAVWILGSLSECVSDDWD